MMNDSMNRGCKKRAAFTLIELLVVVSILSILALIAVPNFSEAQTRTKVAVTHNNMRAVAVKFEMLNVDWSRYPMAAKWRWTLLWWVPTWVDGEDKYDKFDRAYNSMFGPHEDVFEWEAMKRHRIQDYEWMARRSDRTFLANGFNFFHPASIVEAINVGCEWDDMDIENWKKLTDMAGGWMMYSPGPDLVINTPFWIYAPGWGYGESGDKNYNEKRLFHVYDPTNGTVSYGNIFRTQKGPGLSTDAHFYE